MRIPFRMQNRVVMVEGKPCQDLVLLHEINCMIPMAKTRKPYIKVRYLEGNSEFVKFSGLRTVNLYFAFFNNIDNSD